MRPAQMLARVYWPSLVKLTRSYGRSGPPGRHLPVALTGHYDPEMANAELDVICLRKPVDPAQILAIVEEQRLRSQLRR